MNHWFSASFSNQIKPFRITGKSHLSLTHFGSAYWDLAKPFSFSPLNYNSHCLVGILCDEARIESKHRNSITDCVQPGSVTAAWVREYCSVKQRDDSIDAEGNSWRRKALYFHFRHWGASRMVMQRNSWIIISSQHHHIPLHAINCWAASGEAAEIAVLRSSLWSDSTEDWLGAIPLNYLIESLIIYDYFIISFHITTFILSAVHFEMCYEWLLPSCSVLWIESIENAW